MVAAADTGHLVPIEVLDYLENRSRVNCSPNFHISVQFRFLIATLEQGDCAPFWRAHWYTLKVKPVEFSCLLNHIINHPPPPPPPVVESMC